MASGSRFALLRQLFDQVCDLDVEQRRIHLRSSGADTALAAEVEALVAAETQGLRRASAPVAALLAQLPETELDVGDRVGAWRLVEKLASGGMGAVYRAERADGHFEQQAAIKLLRGIPTDDALHLLAAERQILAGLQHPHIARLIDGGATPGGQPYLVLEFVEGIAVDRWCLQQQLDLRARLRLFRNICRAVAFAHQRLIVHCDLKPSNVLVRADGAPVLLDFGIARALDRSRERAGTSYYTPGYASPEQIAGAPVSVASDVYSLGLILFELVSGRKARLEADERTLTQLTRGLQRPSDLSDEQCRWRHRLRGDIDAIILRATATNPGLRYASADALAEDIERHLDVLPVHARAPSWRYRLGRLLQRRWPMVAAGVLVLAMALGFSWRLVNERDRALAAERQARVQAETAGQVSEFLISIFEFANPEKNPSRSEVSARDMLDESTRRLETGLADRPEVKARLLDVLARAWNMLGQPQRSLDLYRASEQAWQRAGAGHVRERYESLSRLAVLQSSKGLVKEAEASALESLHLREADAQHSDEDLAEAWNTLGVVYTDLWDDAQAEAYLLRALQIRRASGHVHGQATLHNLARLYTRQGKFDQAIALFEETLAAKRLQFGSDEHPAMIGTLRAYARALSGKRRYDEAMAIYRRLIELHGRFEGENSDNIADVYNEMGSDLQDAGRYQEAIASYRESLRRRRESGLAVTSSLVLPINNLAVALEETGDFAAAEPLSRESLQLRRDSRPADDPAVLRAEHNLARLLLRTNRLDEARPLLAHALAERVRQLDAGNLDLGRSRLLQVELLRRAGRLDDAAAGLAELDASTLRDTALGRSQRERERARLAQARQQPELVLPALRQAYALLADALGKEHPLTASAALELALALRADGQAGEANSLLLQSRPVVLKNFAATAPEQLLLSQLDAPLP
ncbi:serine/threonine-protein kinase [Tahibacter aquaticus]|uniref:Serine/threonine-protein kinase n=1 Tax=Tahibacter aquaticus TaxID=520092 RepID=A0A4R6ZA45_9GAMM|nr:serine/threonine-protein kinase [Tahibacter aquaticus]TDR48801.1 serine/threonine-protein kinase [Tahibacter aquaticus]